MSFGKRWHNLNPYDLHKTLINEYLLTSKNKSEVLRRDTSKDKRDNDVIRENHQFLWEDEEEESFCWEKRLAKKYYDKLYKEYCVGDFSRYKENKIGLRWRTEQELINGKGQFNCGNKKCREKEKLRTWEVNFSYVEHGVKKNALVKLRLCPDCSHKLNYHHKKKEVKRLKVHSKFKEEKRSSVVKESATESSEQTDVEVKDVKDVKDDKTDIWKQSCGVEEVESKSREEEFDEYLNQLLL